MRKITRDAVNAFEGYYNFKRDNTRVESDSFHGSALMYLHGNLIAESHHGLLRISDAGWSTTVTKERLNGLSGVSIRQKDYQWYLNGELWNGEWVVVSR